MGQVWRGVTNQRGTSSVEFILIAPFLLFILFASVELSRAWFTLNLMTTAAREAVRAGVVAPADQVSAVGNARLNEILGAGNYSGGVTCSTNPCGENSRVTADIAMNFDTVVPVLLPMLQGIALQQTASMVFENWQ